MTETLFWAREGEYVKGCGTIEPISRGACLASLGGRAWWLSLRDFLGLIRLRDSYLLFARAIDIGNDVEVLVQLNPCRQRPARFSARAQQAGQLHKAKVLEGNDIAALRRRKRFRFGDGILCPVKIYATKIGFFCG